METRPNQASKGLCSHPGGAHRGDSARTPSLHTHPWKLPGTVILRFTSAFMTRLTISYSDPDMFLVSRPSKRFSTSSLQTEEDAVTSAASARLSPAWTGQGESRETLTHSC